MRNKKYSYSIFFLIIFFFVFGTASVNLANETKSYFYDLWFLNNKFYDFFLGYLFYLIIFVIIYSVDNKNTFFSYSFAWLIKGGFLFTIFHFFESVYGMDKDGFFTNANIFNPLFYEKSFQGTVFVHNIIKIFSFNLIINSFYYIKIIFLLIPFLALIIFYELSKKFVDDKHKVLFLFLFFWPSVMLWTSEINKDSLILLPIAIFFYSIYNKKFLTLQNIALIILSFILCYYIRDWYNLIFIAILSLKVIYLQKSFFYFKSIILIILVTFATFFLLNNFELFEIIQNQKKHFTGGSTSYDLVYKNYFDFIKLPIIILKILFLPPNFLLNPFSLSVMFENFVLFLFFLIFMFSLITNFKSINLPIYIILFIVAWLSMYSIIVSNLGSLIRYKIAIYPFIFIIFLSSIYPKKI